MTIIVFGTMKIKFKVRVELINHRIIKIYGNGEYNEYICNNRMRRQFKPYAGRK